MRCTQERLLYNCSGIDNELGSLEFFLHLRPCTSETEVGTYKFALGPGSDRSEFG